MLARFTAGLSACKRVPELRRVLGKRYSPLRGMPVLRGVGWQRGRGSRKHAMLVVGNFEPWMKTSVKGGWF